MGTTKRMDHEAYQKRTINMSEEALLYTIRDAMEAAEAAREIGSPNEGYYLDEIHYCRAELRRRETLAGVKAVNGIPAQAELVNVR